MKWRACRCVSTPFPGGGSDLLMDGYAYAHCKCGKFHLSEENDRFRRDGTTHTWSKCGKGKR